jgi:hypothetical protein
VPINGLAHRAHTDLSLARFLACLRKLRSREQARRVAWRITLSWLEAQLALIQAGLATLDQVFLPFCQDPAGVTLYERMRQAKFSGLLLEEGSEEINDARKLY